MIRLDKLTKVFEHADRKTVAADSISMTVPDGEICVLLGPSGCGKTTTLKMINRIVVPTSGKVYINGEDTSDVDTVELRRSIGYVIQQIGLFPNMTIEENVCVVPRLLGWSKEKSKRRAAELLEMMALDPSEFLKRYPKELSGGQQQRVGVARALAADPPVLLMDEPFGAIDPINRESIQDEFLKMQQVLRKTVLFVSHDIDEAVKMGDKIAIFRDGRLEQFSTPDALLAHPANEFVADFLGNDRTLKRLRLLKVSDVMDKSVVTVTPQDSLKYAATLMVQAEQSTIVVLDSQKCLLGTLFLKDAIDRSGDVKSHYRVLPTKAHVDEDLRSAVSSMFRHGISWLACVDANDVFYGCITQRGIRHELGGVYRNKEAALALAESLT
ncbi:ABC transporter ATP-binding protein [Alcaligenaceae bacterium]|nr:ABC transporter ATP-binding protein [Alcaligenaceae bacterium]